MREAQKGKAQLHALLANAAAGVRSAGTVRGNGAASPRKLAVQVARDHPHVCATATPPVQTRTRRNRRTARSSGTASSRPTPAARGASRVRWDLFDRRAALTSRYAWAFPTAYSLDSEYLHSTTQRGLSAEA